jgi:hypothetical protein
MASWQDGQRIEPTCREGIAMTLRVTSSDQWQELSRSGLGVVVDPMVVRCGEIFLKGQAGNAEPDAAWSFLDKNVGALSLFFDMLVLEKSIPIFNYGDTFDAKLNFNERVLSQINDIEPVLYDVDVEHKPYHEVKDAAFSELRKLYSGPQKIPSDLAKSIVSEMDAAEYKWSVSLEDLGI